MLISKVAAIDWLQKSVCDSSLMWHYRQTAGPTTQLLFFKPVRQYFELNLGPDVLPVWQDYEGEFD